MGWLLFLIAWWIFYLYQLVSSLFTRNAGGLVLWFVLGGIASWIIGIICQAGMEGNGKPKYTEVVDPALQKIRNSKQLNKSDLDLILKEYNKSVHQLINDPNKSEFDLTYYTSKFQESLHLWGRIYEFMTQLQFDLLAHNNFTKNKEDELTFKKSWQSKVIPLSTVEGKFEVYNNTGKKEFKLKYNGILALISKINDDYEGTRLLEVFQKNKLVYRLEIKTHARNDSDYDIYGGYKVKAGSVFVFKPSEWIITLLNLANEYELERQYLAKEISRDNKEKIKNNYLADN